MNTYFRAVSIYLACTISLNLYSSDKNEFEKISFKESEGMNFITNKLYEACGSCNASLVKALLGKIPHKLNQNELNEFAKTTLASCTKEKPKQTINILDQLFEQGLDPDYIDTNGKTLLLTAGLIAAQTCSFNPLKHIMQKGANPDRFNRDTSLVSTIGVFYAIRRNRNCPTCSKEVFQCMQQFSKSNQYEQPLEYGVQTNDGHYNIVLSGHSVQNEQASTSSNSSVQSNQQGGALQNQPTHSSPNQASTNSEARQSNQTPLQKDEHRYAHKSLWERFWQWVNS